MAGHPGSTASTLPASAHVVGNAFVNQYYNVLHQSPHVVHRFYTDASRVTRAEAGIDGAVDTFVSQSEIHQKVIALDYGDFRAEIATVDSQDSLGGGVLVMVTGSLYFKTSGKRNFVQTFFLAPQEKGYFVLNDIFRYVDEEPLATRRAPAVPTIVPEPPQVHVAPEPEPTLPEEHEVRMTSPAPSAEVEPIVEEIFESHDQVAVVEAEDDAGHQDLAGVGITAVIDEPPSPITSHVVSALPVEEVSEEAPKKSYASIVSSIRMKENVGSTVPPNAYNSVPKAAPQVSTADRPAPSATRALPAASQDSMDEGGAAETEVDGKSVYVKHLPMNVTTQQLEEEFGKFGVLKPSGVNLKNQKAGICYAFIEFEETTSAQSAIEASPITIGGRQVYIEEKRHMSSRPSGRPGGGRSVGAGRGPFRNDGLRGRGAMSGRGPSNRGFGMDRDRDLPNKGRGAGPYRGNYGGANGGDPEGLSAGAERRDFQWGNGSRGPKRGNDNQALRNGVESNGSAPVAAVK